MMQPNRDRQLLRIGLFCAVTLAPTGPGFAGTADRVEFGGETRTTVDSYSDASDPQLRSLIEALLRDNPELRSARARSRSSFDRVAQVRSLPDPQLSYRYFALPPETRVGPQEHAVELSQKLPWKGKRGLQAEQARLTAAGSTWDARNLERQLVAELKRSYFRASYLREAIAINHEERNLLRRFEGIALKRYATGEGIQQSAIKVQTDITRLDDLETDLREQLRSTMRRIQELIDSQSTDLSLAPAPLEAMPVHYDPSRLEQKAVRDHPAVLSTEQRIGASQAWSRRRRLESRPDFRVGIGYTLVDEREDTVGIMNPPDQNGQDVLSLMVGINLPVYRGKIDAGVSEAEESILESEERLSTTRNRLRFMLQDAILRLESFQERGRLYDEVLIPQAQESLASSEAAYTTGRQGFLDLLDAERVLFQVRLTYRRLISDYWIALTDVEFAIADQFPGTSDAHPASGGAVAGSEAFR